MIDINLPSSLAGVLLLAIIGFVVVSALITSGAFPVIIAVLLAVGIGYVLYVLLTAIHRWVMYG